MQMAGHDGTASGGRTPLRWRRAIPWDRLRLREKASMLVFSVALMLGLLVTLIVVLEHLDRGGLITAETARATQLSLDRFSLAMNNQRTALAPYLLAHGTRALEQYPVGRDEA